MFEHKALPKTLSRLQHCPSAAQHCSQCRHPMQSRLGTFL